MTSLKGSEWRRWDLHIHTPYTKLSNDYKGKDAQTIWEKYIEVLEKSPIQAFGITDYFSCENCFTLIDKYRIKYPQSTKVFFINIEFRLAEAISIDSNNPHIHVIFDNDQDNCSKAQIEKFLSTLETLGETNTGVHISCADLTTEAQFNSASVTIEKLKEALKSTFGESRPYLIGFPAKNDGVRSTDSKSPRKVLITDKIDKLSDLFFGDSSNKDYFLGKSRYTTGKSEPKPVISGSDAHSFNELDRLEGNVANFEPTWIKADLTFRGLCQICFEPEARVFIGSQPAVESRKSYQATKFLSKLKIDQVKGYDEANGEWFKNFEIPLNPELTVIIGNKGSGKSALVDIIGLLSDSRQERYFSFLSNDNKNKKFRQKGYAENFFAEIEWESSNKISKSLSDRVNFSKPEAVRYLPQSYFEQLTNEIEIETFRHEIEDVVFSHVDQTDRMGESTFAELQEFKTQQSAQETNALKARLEKLNIEIIRLEGENDPLYKERLKEELKTKKAELSALEKTEPKKELKPDDKDPKQKEISNKIVQLTKLLKILHKADRSAIELTTHSKSKLQKLTSLGQGISALSTKIVEHKKELKPMCEDLNLDIEQLVIVEINVDSIEELKLSARTQMEELEKENGLQFNNNIDFTNAKSIPELRAAQAYVKQRLSILKEQQDTPQRKYQTYLDRFAKWKDMKAEIIGSDSKLVPGTIKYLESKVSYIENDLSKRILAAYAKRKDVSRKIYISKEQILNFYTELKSSVEAKLNSVSSNDFSIDINASFVLDRSFVQTFLNLINKRRTGSFYGIENAQNLVKRLLDDTDWNDFDSIYNFIKEVLNRIKYYNNQPNPIKEQVTNIKEFYDLLFSLEYFSPQYELRLGGKSLNELSPGEKGLLLLVFYLQLDKKNTPLIIDQPEDNLDNESIFTVLANCIRKAKENRQVILVTHNPNLAIGADAEQVVYVQLQKSNNYKFTYETGAIENPRINTKILNVLEGTQPAFVKRRLKYNI